MLACARILHKRTAKTPPRRTVAGLGLGDLGRYYHSDPTLLNAFICGLYMGGFPWGFVSAGIQWLDAKKAHPLKDAPDSHAGALA